MIKEQVKFLNVPCSKQFYIEARTLAGSLDISLAELARRAITEYIARAKQNTNQNGQGKVIER